MIIIKFNHAVPKDKRDPELLEKFRTEVDGILLFALEGVKRLMKNGFNFSETQANLEALQQYKEDSNSCLAYVKECCEIDASREVGVTYLYDRYKAFCKENGMLPYGKQTFNKELESNFGQIVRGRDTTLV